MFGNFVSTVLVAFLAITSVANAWQCYDGLYAGYSSFGTIKAIQSFCSQNYPVETLTAYVFATATATVDTTVTVTAVGKVTPIPSLLITSTLTTTPSTGPALPSKRLVKPICRKVTKDDDSKDVVSSFTYKAGANVGAICTCIEDPKITSITSLVSATVTATVTVTVGAAAGVTP